MAVQAGVLVDAKQAHEAVPGAGRRAGTDGASEGVTAEQLWTKYAARLTGIVVRYLRADYWHMPQASCHETLIEELCSQHISLCVCVAIPYPAHHVRSRLTMMSLSTGPLTWSKQGVACCVQQSAKAMQDMSVQSAGEGAGSHGHLRQCQEAHRAQPDGQGAHL